MRFSLACPLALFGALLAFLCAFAPPAVSRTIQAPAANEVSAFSLALDAAERSLSVGQLPKAREWIQRALERDAKAPRAWALRARWAEAAKDRDDLVYSIYTQLRLSVAQKAPKAEIAALRERLIALEPIAKELLNMNARFIGALQPLAEQYEKDLRPHSAIGVHKLILAIDPEYTASQEAIERISSLPDPSLAEDAKPKDLLADVSDEWIREFDAQHATWDVRAKLERENYTTYTNAGYEVLVRAAEAMEQMNLFYREFFQYGTAEDGKSVPRIDLNIFKLRAEYLKLGIGPPVEWSGGHFTGSAVETYVEGSGFGGMTQTLFHEAAHQFVSLATRAAGWLNEGLASFFEGCAILPNGSVLMNMPANHRLFPLAENMERGWMSGPTDGIDPADPAKSSPDKAPTFRIVVENDYAWGPPWYAPTWGVVFFLYNYQDPIDGRFIYRAAFREYINASGGLTGDTAISKFEEVVLAQPQAPIKGVERDGALEPKLPKTIDELSELWKEWTLALRDEQLGRVKVERPYLAWARAALLAKDDVIAKEHFEKGLVATPFDAPLLEEFATFLGERKNDDRAAKLATTALRVLEAAKPVDKRAVERVDRLLTKWDPKRGSIARTKADLAKAALELVEKLRGAALPMLTMDVSWRLGRDLEIDALFGVYETALRESGKSLAIWELAYNEKNLEGWDAGGNTTFKATGPLMEAKFGAYDAARFDYQGITLQRVTGGDFSLECELQARRGENNFCGLVFGRKDANNFHALVLFPGAPRESGAKSADNAWVDLASFYGGGSTKTWRHVPVKAFGAAAAGQSAASEWRKLRIDVARNMVDCWVDGELVATHEFPSADVLRGTFGLLMGPGKASYKEVRFLARDPRDPAGEIERRVRMEKLRGSGQPVGGSYLGLVPPLPKVERWAQGERTSWSEKGLVPQLLVLWSIQQNDLIRLDPWLAFLAREYANVGLEIVSVCSANDAPSIDEYLKTHPFPGAVGVDHREGVGMGSTADQFAIERFNLPRLLLLDVDGKVAWEGDPGFKIGEEWQPGLESFLEAPLKDLIERRKLAKVGAWTAEWNEFGAADLLAGDLAKAWPRMQTAKELDGAFVPLAHDVQKLLAALEAAFADLPKAGAQLDKAGRVAALRTLVDWATLGGVTLDKRLASLLKPHLESAQAKDWERALKQIETAQSKGALNRAAAEDLASKLAALKGPFAAELAQELRDAAADSERVAAVLADAPRRPARWLVREHFRWQ
jgi:hypothetical protein